MLILMSTSSTLPAMAASFRLRDISGQTDNTTDKTGMLENIYRVGRNGKNVRQGSKIKDTLNRDC